MNYKTMSLTQLQEHKDNTVSDIRNELAERALKHLDYLVECIDLGEYHRSDTLENFISVCEEENHRTKGLVFKVQENLQGLGCCSLAYKNTEIEKLLISFGYIGDDIEGIADEWFYISAELLVAEYERIS